MTTDDDNDTKHKKLTNEINSLKIRMSKLEKSCITMHKETEKLTTKLKNLEKSSTSTARALAAVTATVDRISKYIRLR